MTDTRTCALCDQELASIRHRLCSPCEFMISRAGCLEPDQSHA